jgi:hypothetical protein
MRTGRKQVDFIRPDLDALTWLRGPVAECKRDSLLQPVTVIVPNCVIGRFILRELAHEPGS